MKPFPRFPFFLSTSSLVDTSFRSGFSFVCRVRAQADRHRTHGTDVKAHGMKHLHIYPGFLRGDSFSGVSRALLLDFLLRAQLVCVFGVGMEDFRGYVRDSLRWRGGVEGEGGSWHWGPGIS